jgi:hypothetical protein
VARGGKGGLEELPDNGRVDRVAELEHRIQELGHRTKLRCRGAALLAPGSCLERASTAAGKAPLFALTPGQARRHCDAAGA